MGRKEGAGWVWACWQGGTPRLGLPGTPEPPGCRLCTGIPAAPMGPAVSGRAAAQLKAVVGFAKRSETCIRRLWHVADETSRRMVGQEEGTWPWCLPGLGGSAEARKCYFWVGSALLLGGVGADPGFCCGEAGGERRAMEKCKRHEAPRVDAGDLPLGKTDTWRGKGNSVLLETHIVFGKGHLSWRTQ